MSSQAFAAARVLLVAALALPSEQLVLATTDSGPAEPPTPWAPCSLIGKKEVLLLKNGEKIVGHVLECRTLSWVDYGMAYAAWRSGNNALHLPALGESIAMHRGSPDSRDFVTGTLFGFDFDRVLIRERGQKSVTALPAEGGLILNDASTRVDGKTLQRALVTGRVPVATTALVLDVKGIQTEVAVKNISAVKRPNNGAKVFGWTVGIAVVSVVAIAVALNAALGDYSNQKQGLVHAKSRASGTTMRTRRGPDSLMQRRH